MGDARLDLKGMKCPLPVLKARKALSRMDSGEVLDVLTTDPGAPADFRAFCETTGHLLVNQTEQRDGAHLTRIKKR